MWNGLLPNAWSVKAVRCYYQPWNTCPICRVVCLVRLDVSGERCEPESCFNAFPNGWAGWGYSTAGDIRLQKFIEEIAPV